MWYARPSPTDGSILLYWHRITQTAEVQPAILVLATPDPSARHHECPKIIPYAFATHQALMIPQDRHHDQGHRSSWLDAARHRLAKGWRYNSAHAQMHHSHVVESCAARLRTNLDVLVCVCSWSWLTVPAWLATAMAACGCDSLRTVQRGSQDTGAVA